MYLVQGKYSEAIAKCQKILDGNYFEFEFLYTDESERFREIDRFLYESRHTLRFENEYRGNVVIDISDWNEKTNSYFDAFMYFLKDNAAKYHPGQGNAGIHIPYPLFDQDLMVGPIGTNDPCMGQLPGKLHTAIVIFLNDLHVQPTFHQRLGQIVSDPASPH